MAEVEGFTHRYDFAAGVTPSDTKPERIVRGGDGTWTRRAWNEGKRWHVEVSFKPKA